MGTDSTGITGSTDIIPILDGHNDLPWAIRDKHAGRAEDVDLTVRAPGLHTDLPRARAGGLAAQFWSVFVPSDMLPAEAVVATLEQIDVVHRLAARYPDDLALVDSAAEAREAMASGRIASLLGIEGGHCIDSSPGVLRMMRRAGVRYMTLTHNDDVPWAASATGEDPSRGLDDVGRGIVEEMNRIGMIVDLSHVSAAVMHDALDVTSRPVMFSHSSCRAVTDHPRNIPDDVLTRVPGNGGVAMMTFVPKFVSAACAGHAARAADGPASDADAGPAPEATLADVIAHIEHAREVAGIDHIGLGGDFDGIDVLPAGFDGVAAYRLVMDELADRGWTEADRRKLGAENALRVIAAND